MKETHRRIGLVAQFMIAHLDINELFEEESIPSLVPRQDKSISNQLMQATGYI